MAEDLSGLRKSEWYDLEGNALRAEAESTGDSSLLREGVESGIYASDERLKEYLTEQFKRLFPGNEVPQGTAELSSKVQMRIGILPEEEGGNE